MAKLEIDIEDVHDSSEWKRNVNVMKRKYNPIGKRSPSIMCAVDFERGLAGAKGVWK